MNRAPKNLWAKYGPIAVKLLTSIIVDIECREDGNIFIAQEISDALQAKIIAGLLTP